ncbi:hypothetical protein [Halobacterium hubeiense]|uniref:hypothetical protein n=1 Tax=Halobacterium hubeiense TaxID=1407499 RepID=UPI003C777A9A
MTDRSRRAFLAAGAGVLAATAGCSRLPVVGDDEPSPAYDYERLVDAPTMLRATVSTPHPGPVPDALAEAHAERAATLLEGVPEYPSIPNGAVAARIRDDREHAAESVADGSTAVSTLDELAGWRSARADAAEVSGAYAAATGDVDPQRLRERRDAVRADLDAFRDEWAYRGRNVVEAVAVHRNVEELAMAARDALVPARSFPADPKAAVFEVGQLVRSVERARAAVDDAAGLRDAAVGDGAASYRDAIATAAVRLQRATAATERRLHPYVDPETDVADFERDLRGTPAEWLFNRAKPSAGDAVESVERAVERGDYASAVAESGRSLVALLVLESAVEAIRDGEYGMPESTDDVLDVRERAVDAVEETEGMEPRSLTDAFAGWARRALRDAERALAGNPQYSYGDELPDRENVRNAVAGYALATHVVEAIPPVADRVTAELREAAGERAATDA